jgi:two-component system LytT family response regulator
MKNLKILILEDDIDSAKLYELYLRKYFKEIHTIFLAHTLETALDCFFENKPNILFLDVNIGNDLVFAFLEKINTENVYKICITSHEHYAVKAYEFHVHNYLVKPVLIEKFIDVTTRAINWIANNNSKTKTQNVTVNKSFIAISSANKVEIVSMENIIYLEADGRYTIFHLKDAPIKMSTLNMGEYENLLDKNMFIRTHHKFIININEVRTIEKNVGYDCLMSNNKLLPVSKRKVSNLIQFLNLK